MPILERSGVVAGRWRHWRCGDECLYSVNRNSYGCSVSQGLSVKGGCSTTENSVAGRKEDEPKDHHAKNEELD
jgi:hypothetical protein